MSFCHSCPLGKSSKLPFKLSESVSTFPLQLVHSDVWSSPFSSVQGFKYYLIFIDDYSHYSWLFPMRFKHEVFNLFVQFKQYVENLLSAKIKSFQSDGGGEFTSRVFTNFLRNHGIHHRLFCPHTPEQNGLAERKHRHVVETGLTLLAQAHMPSSYWVVASNTALYLINRLPSHLLGFKSPFGILFHQSPKYNFLRVFGCACFPCLRPYNNNKMDFRSKSCVFIDYSLNHHGYQCLDRSSGHIYLSRHV